MILEKNQDKIIWFNLSLNTNENAIKLLLENQDKLSCWYYLSLNNNDKIIKLLKDNPEKIDWKHLSANTNDYAIEILKQNRDKIDWYTLIFNPNYKAIELIRQESEKNKYLIGCPFLFKNRSIFELDYEAIKKNNEPFEEELIKEVMKPSRIFKMIETYGDNYLEIIFE